MLGEFSPSLQIEPIGAPVNRVRDICTFSNPAQMQIEQVFRIGVKEIDDDDSKIHELNLLRIVFLSCSYRFCEQAEVISIGIYQHVFPQDFFIAWHIAPQLQVL